MAAVWRDQQAKTTASSPAASPPAPQMCTSTQTENWPPGNSNENIFELEITATKNRTKQEKELNLENSEISINSNAML